MAITKASSNAVAPAAKGDLIAGTTTNDSGVLAVGANGTVLTAASGETTGLKWAAASSGMTLIQSTSVSAVSSQSFNDVFSSTYQNYKILIDLTGSAAANLGMRVRVSGTDNTSGNYYTAGVERIGDVTTVTGIQAEGATSFTSLCRFESSEGGGVSMDLFNPFAAQKTTYVGTSVGKEGANLSVRFLGGQMSVTTSYTGFTLFVASGNFTGKVSIYGYSI